MIPRAACADRLDLVDAAMARPGSDESHELRSFICPTCELAGTCLLLGVARSEHGVWGGTSPQERRARYGSRMPSAASNITGIRHGYARGAA